ncbi:MAG: radical SAM protein [Thermodesulfovibrionaceae bacterium]
MDIIKPKFLIWIFTPKCNLFCSHCYVAKFSLRELSLEEKLKVAKQAVECGIERINLTGGEVLIDEEVWKVIYYLLENNVSLSIFTNGVALTEQTIRKFQELNIYILLSVDGAKKQTYELIRGKNNWEKLILNMKRLKESEVSFSTVMAINSFNYKEVEDYIWLSQEFGAKNACFIPVMLTGRANKQIVIDSKIVFEVLKTIDKVAEDSKFQISLWCMPFAEAFVSSEFISISNCRNWKYEIEIDPLGNVMLCDILDITISNVISDGFCEAWRKLRDNPLYKYLSNPTFFIEPCKSCSIRDRCKGGCYARAGLFGNIYSPDPLCPTVNGF